jgi:hypothetical protein
LSLLSRHVRQLDRRAAVFDRFARHGLESISEVPAPKY